MILWKPEFQSSNQLTGHKPIQNNLRSYPAQLLYFTDEETGTQKESDCKTSKGLVLDRYNMPNGGTVVSIQHAKWWYSVLFMNLSITATLKDQSFMILILYVGLLEF